MTDLPEPPVPSDVDLRDFRRMPFDVLALDNSAFDLTTDDDEFRAGFRLWCKAWHQVPAGSLPNDDRQLCQLAGLGRDIDGWQRIKAKAMHGFVLCRDGRWYHTFLCEIVLEAWDRKHKYAKKRAASNERVRRYREAQRKKREEDRKAPRSPPPTSPGPQQVPPQEPAPTPDVAPPKKDGKPKEASLLDDLPDPLEEKFEEWWALFPRFRRGSKGPAKKKWESIVRRRKATVEQLFAGLRRYLDAGYGPSKSACGAERWLNDERWTIEAFPPPVDASEPTQGRARGMAAPDSRDSFRHTPEYDQELEEKTRSWGPKL